MEEDEAALLAELKAISNRSATSRFDDDNDTNAELEMESTGAPQDREVHPVSAQESNRLADDPVDEETKESVPKALPPWKRKGRSVKSKQPDVVIVAAPPAPTEATADDPLPDDSVGFGIKSEIHSSFQGERGGAAQDAELLALLRGVSAKSASATRFNDDNDDIKRDTNNNHADHSTDTTAVMEEESEKPTTATSNETSSLPPWKRKGGKNKQQQPDVEVVVAVPPNAKGSSAKEEKPSTAKDETVGFGIKSDIPSTFQGERGGAAEDAELLALLRGVSAKSSSASRFANDDDDQDTGDGSNRSAKEKPAKQQAVATDSVPPWKRKGMKASVKPKEPDVMVVTAPPPSSADPPHMNDEKPMPDESVGLGIKSDTASTFQGERGGAAEDAELLALLRGVSSKSASASRFADDSNEELASTIASETNNREPAPSNGESLPPWKRKGAKNSTQSSQPDVGVVVPPVPSTADQIDAPMPDESAGFGIKSDIPSSFHGERSGAAEDQELLAMLRGVSAQSSGASRFVDTETADGISSGAAQADTPKPPSKSQPVSDQTLPPWKRKRTKRPEQQNVDVVIAAPPVDGSENKGDDSTLHESAGFGIKSGVPSSFKGERGGAAEDAELLALLRGVSTKSAGASRFADDGDNGSSDIAGQEFGKPRPPKDDLPPLKRKGGSSNVIGEKKVVTTAPTTGPLRADSPPDETIGYGIKSDIASNFQGERGGAAEDAELLALLRGVSAQSSSTSRFAEGGENMENSVPPSSSEPSRDQGDSNNGRRATVKPTPSKTSTVEQPRSSRSSEQSSGDPEELQLSRDQLPDALNDRNWKVRSKAFEYMDMLLLAEVRGKELSEPLESDTILPGLDTLVPKFVEESHPATLDRAIEFGLHYADHCNGAGKQEVAGAVVSSLLKKNGFSSRPSTQKLAASLALKLMEVGNEGASSLQAVVEVVIADGLSSRKPKVVQAASLLIYDSMVEFGAGHFPLLTLTKILPKVLVHANAGVRENGVKIVAELCRTLGSKDSLQDVIYTMKKAQIAELDRQLAEQPSPSEGKTPFRRQETIASSRDTASLADQAKMLAADRFAARPAVDVILALKGTEYSSRIEHQKWSEKVAALKLVLECGGEKPYKLVPPSPAANYVPLISDMKKLLSHTHFAVCVHAMKVLSMLAEGTSEKLFTHLRPLLSPLLQLSKDKKLNKAVGECLDSFFGNLLSIEHLMDPNDALPESLDERKQRNALARAAAMEYLQRCVERGASAGPRGAMNVANVKSAASLCIEKLDDSDATVRKAAMEVLLSLQKNESQEAQSLLAKLTESLKSSNPRAYKALCRTETTVKASPKKNPVKDPTSSNRPPPAGQVAIEKHVPSARPSDSTASAKLPVVKKDSQGEKSGEPTVEEAMVFVTTLNVPLWGAAEDDGGVRAGLESSKWLQRQNAIQRIGAYIDSGEMESFSSDVSKTTSTLLKVVKEHTRGFKETNVNVMKSIITLFLSCVGYHESREQFFPEWASVSGTTLAVQKLSDRKLSSFSKELLTRLCVVSSPSLVVETLSAHTKSSRSPVVHEEALRWFQTFCTDFGISSVGTSLSNLLPWITEEISATNPKVKREAFKCAKLLFTQVGPKLKALSMSLAKSPGTRAELEKCFSDCEYDPASLPGSWPLQSLFSKGPVSAEASDGSVNLMVPKTDLFSLLPVDVETKMNMKDGKAAWKQRKEALEETESCCRQISGMIDTSGPNLKKLVGLVRVLRDRLADTQINLKPIAARVLGTLLSLVDKTTQAKLGKIAYAPLLNGAMTDIKKPMRDSCVEALRHGTTEPAIEGGSVNNEAMEPLIAALVSSITDASLRSNGLPEILAFLHTIADKMPNLDSMTARGQSLGVQYASVIVECLTSSKSETRSAANELLESTIRNSVVTPDSLKQATEKLKPAKQRTIAPIVSKVVNLSQGALSQEGPAVKKDISSRVANSVSRASRDAPRDRPTTASSTSEKTVEKSKEHTSVRHPLAPRSSTSRPLAKIVWTEYPEEPHGAILENLKKAWSHVLSHASTSALFPAKGISKQDDAEKGCALLLDALKVDKSTGSLLVKDQLEFIFKWMAFVLCSRETTVGLQALLDVLHTLFSYLLSLELEVPDNVALEILPYILEKASNAKGRFKEGFDDVVRLACDEKLLPTKRLGAVVAVAVIERSSHARARALACNICRQCVDMIGLNACGKRGVLATAKSLSEDKVPESRLAALELMESIFQRMNGDTSRLTRICGPNLSDKALGLLQEKHRKRTVGSETPARVTTRSEPNRTPNSSSSNGPSNLRDELPALSLRSDIQDVPRQSHTSAHSPSQLFSFSAAMAPEKDDDNLTESLPEQNASASASVGAKENGVAENLGSVSSLRARLLKIREKAKPAGESPMENAAEKRGVNALSAKTATEIFDEDISIIRHLISLNGPLPEDHTLLLACVDSLKRFHAALSKQTNSSLGLTVSKLAELRECIYNNLNPSIETMTRLLDFAFNCGEGAENAGMCIPLLSVDLAALMALFRDPDASRFVSQDTLVLLIRETGSALLDERLTPSSELDDATGSQMVRAINKLAVQAATGATRHVAFLCLMSLQQQLALETTGSDSFQSRLSRVVLKLFVRVVKAEDGTRNPFGTEDVDVESIVCAMEDLLTACQKSEGASAPTVLENCRQMCESLVKSILSALGTDALLSILEEVGISPSDSYLGTIILSTDEGNEQERGHRGQKPADPPKVDLSSSSPDRSRDIAKLVSALANSQPGTERESALKALRSYRSIHGDEALDAHLKHVSASFRSFIEELLRTDQQNPVAAPDHIKSNMSQRLKSLRSRLQATELVLQEAADTGDSEQTNPTHTSSPSRIPSPRRRSSRQATRLAPPSPSVLGSASAPSANLQQKLAAAQDSRKANATTAANGVGTSMGRAAALRARLEAVKKKSKADDT